MPENDWDHIHTTRYFKEQVLNKRDYIKPEWCLHIIKEKLNMTKQEDSRIRFWGYIMEADKYLRVVTLEDGITIHNAFFDRNFKQGDKL